MTLVLVPDAQDEIWQTLVYAVATFNVPNAGSHRGTLTQNTTIALATGPSGGRSVVHLLLQQDGTGGRTVSWGSSAISWQGGSAPTLVTTAAYLTFVRFTWMPANNKWFGEATTGIPPPTVALPATYDPGTGIGAQTTLDGCTVRGVQAATYAAQMNAMTVNFSETWRVRMRSRLAPRVEIFEGCPTDTPLYSGLRAGVGPVFQWEFTNGLASGPNLAVGSTDSGSLTHEFGHFEDSSYFYDNEVGYGGLAWEALRHQPPLVALWLDCLAAGAGASNLGVSLVEWYAEMNRARRVAVTGAIGYDATYYTNACGSGSGTITGNECQQVQIAQSSGALPTTGSFTLTWGTDITASITYNDSLATVASKLEALPSIAPGDITVFGGPLPFTFYVVFASAFYGQSGYPSVGSGAYAGTNVAQMSAAGSGGLSVSVSTITAGGALARGTSLQRFDRFRDHLTAIGVSY
jgi:hypothetical protein